MTYRVLWIQSQEEFSVETDETLLAAALRQNINLPHECTFGGCGTCRIKIEEGSVQYEDGELPMSLSDEEHAQGIGLACQARALSDLVINTDNAPACSVPQNIDVIVDAVDLLTPDTVHLRLVLPHNHGIDYLPGQYLNITLDDGSLRSFSMANPGVDNQINLHIRRIPNGRFTDHMLSAVTRGQRLQLHMPHGSFYYREKDYSPMIFAATGTGFAPIRAILASLLDNEDCPPIRFYWGVRHEQDLYMLEELQAWKERLYEFEFIPVVSQPTPNWIGKRGYVQDAIVDDLADLSEHAIYLCGSPAMIQDAKALFTLSGADINKIYADSFLFQNQLASA